MVKRSTKLWTVGHSTRSFDQFKALLDNNSIESLVDVRAFPSSRRSPHFNRDDLSAHLRESSISYRHLSSLGGRRPAREHSTNTAWQNASFRAYADYMETEEFKKGLNELLELASSSRTVIMCAESLWWKCHRSLIADALKASGHVVLHILDKSKVEEHPYTSAARIVDGKLDYRGLLTEC